MLFFGIDFGWRGKPSGMACWAPGRDLELTTIEPLGGILDWIDARAGDGPAMVAVDAPLVIPNASGMRPVERLMHVHFGRFHAGCYPANLGLPFAGRVLALSRELKRRGYRHGTRIAPSMEGRYQIEVHPHAASVQLFRLQRSLKYKKGLIAGRVIVMNQYRTLLANLTGWALPEIPNGGRRLKQVEDMLDAALCAEIGYRYWRHGRAQSDVFGTAAKGYIVVPCRAS